MDEYLEWLEARDWAELGKDDTVVLEGGIDVWVVLERITDVRGEEEDRYTLAKLLNRNSRLNVERSLIIPCWVDAQ